MDENIKEIRAIVKVILKKYNLDIKENKFSVKYVSFADLARDGKYFVEFKDLIKIPKLAIDEIKKTGEEEDFKLYGGISFKGDWLKCLYIK